jgi:outer membrane lipoprotein carrier protein
MNHARIRAGLAASRSACAAALGLALLAPALALAGGVEQLQQFMRETRSARGGFEQIVAAQSGRKPQQSRGTFAFQRPGKFRWEYTKPYPQLLVGDGVKLWSYDRDLNQVTVKTMGDALGSTPAAILAGDDEVQKNFDLADAGTKDGLEWVDARPRRQDGGFESLRMGFADGMLRRMELKDNFGQTTNLLFSAVERNPVLDAATFRFTPPPGADVIGQ